MALINKETNEYIKVKNFNITSNSIQLAIYKDKSTRMNLTKWDAIKKVTVFVGDDLVLNNLADSNLSIYNNIIKACYEALKIATFTNTEYTDDI